MSTISIIEEIYKKEKAQMGYDKKKIVITARMFWSAGDGWPYRIIF